MTIRRAITLTAYAIVMISLAYTAINGINETVWQAMIAADKHPQIAVAVLIITCTIVLLGLVLDEA